jgi:nicotinamidase-related amidase
MANTEDRLTLLTPANSVLALVDYQPAMFKGVASGDKATIKRVAILAATAAQILGIPVVFSSINPDGNGQFASEITSLFPNVEVYSRRVLSFDAFEDERNWKAVAATGRKKLVMSGLWTSMCFAFTALHAIREGLTVYGLIDAAGDSTKDAHKYGIRRMLHAGVIPVTLEQLTSEWMHDWGNPKAGELVQRVYSQHGALIGLK